METSTGCCCASTGWDIQPIAAAHSTRNRISRKRHLRLSFSVGHRRFCDHTVPQKPALTTDAIFFCKNNNSYCKPLQQEERCRSDCSGRRVASDDGGQET